MTWPGFVSGQALAAGFCGSMTRGWQAVDLSL